MAVRDLFYNVITLNSKSPNKTEIHCQTGKRVFLMAPIHHHFEHLGWKEPQIVIRFWIISLILALIGLATLKVR